MSSPMHSNHMGSCCMFYSLKIPSLHPALEYVGSVGVCTQSHSVERILQGDVDQTLVTIL